MEKVCFQAIRQIKKLIQGTQTVASIIMATEAFTLFKFPVNVSTGLMETVFGRVDTANGRSSIFEIVDGVMASIDPLERLMRWPVQIAEQKFHHFLGKIRIGHSI